MKKNKCVENNDLEGGGKGMGVIVGTVNTVTMTHLLHRQTDVSFFKAKLSDATWNPVGFKTFFYNFVFLKKVFYFFIYFF